MECKPAARMGQDDEDGADAAARAAGARSRPRLTVEDPQPGRLMAVPTPDRAPAMLARRWRDAAARLRAACRAVDVSETEETVAEQDAADREASDALGALAAIAGASPELLRAHADALEWLMEVYGVMSEDQHYASLGRTIIAELRLIAGRA